MLWVGEPAGQDKQCEQCSKGFQYADAKQDRKMPTGHHVHELKKHLKLLNDVDFIYNKNEIDNLQNVIP